MKRKLGIFCECLSGISSLDALPLIKKAGFDCYAVCSSDPEELERITRLGDELGMSCAEWSKSLPQNRI